MDRYRWLKQIAIIGAFVWASAGIAQQWNGIGQDGFYQLEWATWRLTLASIFSLTAIALFEGLRLISRSLNEERTDESLPRP